MRVLIILFVIVYSSTITAQDTQSELIFKQYQHYQLWLDCDNRAAVAFQYTSETDTANKKRYTSFYDDVSTPQSCEQKSRKVYKHHDANAPKYDRGHLAAANHFDFDKKALKEANFMTNVLPQTVKLNRGSWKRTEELIECYRDSFPVTTIGGVIWGSDASNDHFTITHGVKTPDYFWRVLLGTAQNGNNYFSAWILPNDASASSANLKHYEVSITQLIEQIEYKEVVEHIKKLSIQSGQAFTYSKGCKAYES